jgi:hypothetical protein
VHSKLTSYVRVRAPLCAKGDFESSEQSVRSDFGNDLSCSLLWVSTFLCGWDVKERNNGFVEFKFNMSCAGKRVERLTF